MRRIVLFFLLAGAFLGGCAGIRPEGDAVPVEAPVANGVRKVEVGQAYLDFAAPEMRGGEVRLSALVGEKVVLLQFWGIRCAPCLAEMPFLASLQERYGERGLAVIGVNTDRVSGPELAQALAARALAPPYPIALDPAFEVAKRYTHWLIPVTVLIDRRGTVHSVHTGYKPELAARIEEDVRALLER